MRALSPLVIALVIAGCPTVGAEGEGEPGEGEGEGEGEPIEIPLRFSLDGVDVGGLDGVGVAFGTVVTDGSVVERELRIEPLDVDDTVEILSDPPVLIGGRDADMWSVVTQPSSSVRPGGATVRVRFAPTIGGPLEGAAVLAFGVTSAERLAVRFTGSGEGPAREPGLRAAIYDGVFNVLPDFSTLAATSTAVQPDLSIAARAATDNFAFLFQGAVDVPAAGSWTFSSTSDDGSRVVVDGVVVVDNDGLHGPVEVSGVVELTLGLHAFEVQFFEQGGGEVLDVQWSGPGTAREPIPAAAFFTAP
ncbi:MAG: PA14 domain-containing protein [Deltaproteobacteria bacterium]|nr:PA14 domain-containing protein [Deltaproteobacteria bacterium]